MSAIQYELTKRIKAKPILASYVELAKPGIVGLSVVSALTGMFFANHGVMPDWSIIIWTFITLGMAVAGSCMLNNYYDRDIDKLFARTQHRPLVTGSIQPNQALVAGLLMVIMSVILMAVLVKISAAWLTAGAIFGYSVVYTIAAKRRSHWANQLGGIAGAMPPVIGYVAVKGYLDINALTLFAIMVIWQQPHALSLALKYKDEYARAGIPVVPVVKGVYKTKLRIAIYATLLLFAALLPYAIGMAGPIYFVTAFIISSAFLLKTIQFLKSDRQYDMRVFFYTIIYLVVLFTTMVYDAL